MINVKVEVLSLPPHRHFIVAGTSIHKSLTEYEISCKMALLIYIVEGEGKR